MHTSTEIFSTARIVGEEKAIELIAKAGFTAWDFSMFEMCRYDYENARITHTGHILATDDYAKFARRLRRIGEDNGIVCNQSHAPFPSVADMYGYLERAIECTAEAGGKICVVHPLNNKTAEENAEMYVKLLPLAKSCNVKIATENMWNWKDGYAAFAACSNPESFVKHVDVVNDPYLVACLDIGHAEMKGLETTAVEMVKSLGARLQALHIHDNDKHYDSHQIPFSMDIDFAPIVKTLKEINYQGDFTLEADAYLKAFDALNVFDGVKNLASVANKLLEMYKNA